MHQTVQDSVSQGRLGQDIVPVFYGELAGHEGRPPIIAVFHDFEKIPLLFRRKRSKAKVVEDQKVSFEK